jgi:hypothetical protein
MRSFDEFLAKTLCSGGGGGGGGGGGETGGTSNTTAGSSDFNEASMGSGAGAGGYKGGYSASEGSNNDYQNYLQSMEQAQNPGSPYKDAYASNYFSGTADATNARWTQIEKELGPLNSIGRAIGNTIAGLAFMNNPGPKAFGDGFKASPGFQFNPGAGIGTYASLATGVPFMGPLGAMAWDNLNNPDPTTNTVAAHNPSPVDVNRSAVMDATNWGRPSTGPNGYDDSLDARLRAAGIRV